MFSGDIPLINHYLQAVRLYVSKSVPSGVLSPLSIRTVSNATLARRHLSVSIFVQFSMGGVPAIRNLRFH